MLFWLFVILLVVGITMCVLTNCSLNYEVSEKYPVLDWLYYNTDINIISSIVSLIAAACVVLSLICIVCEYTTVDSKVASNKVKYESLCYKLESDSVRDDFGLLNKEIVDEIQEWNEDLVYNKEMQDNFWVGIYYPNIYNQFKTIPLK